MRLAYVIPLLIALFVDTNAAVHASESIPVDFRVSLTTMPETDSVHVSYRAPDFNFSATGETEGMRVGWRAEAGLVARMKELTPSLSVVGGAWFFYGDQAGKEYPEGRDIAWQTGPMEMTAMGVDLYAALSWSLSRYLHLEGGPFVGVGVARISDRRVAVSGPDARAEASGSGDYEEAGLQVLLCAHDPERTFLVGLGVRYLVANGEAEFAMDVQNTQTGVKYPNGLHEEVEVRLHGFAPCLTGAITF